MKGKYFHHNEWECWKQGLYNKRPESESRTFLAFYLLSNPVCFELACSVVVSTFNNSTRHHLASMTNPNSWMGQAACYLFSGCTELEVRKAWSRLNESQRKEANKVAASSFMSTMQSVQLTLF